MRTWRSMVVPMVIGLVVLGGFGLRVIVAQSSAGQGGGSPSAKADGLPKDVYPDSRNRLPLVKREDLDEKRKKAYDDAVKMTNPIEGLQGKGGILLHSNTEDVRYGSPLGRALTELAIIVGARSSEQNFEWTLHVEEAIRVGLPMEVIDVVRYKRPTTGLGDKERAIIDVGREMTENHFVTPETFAHALKTLGATNLVDMVATMAYRSNETGLIWSDQHLPLDWVEKAPMPVTIIKSPPDIFPDSRSRLHAMPQAELQRLRQQQEGTSRGGLAPRGMGPGLVGFHSADGKFLEQTFGKRLLELAILVNARELDQQVEWTLHELEARKHGLEPEIIDIVRYRKPLTGLGEKEAAVIQAVRELIGKHKVSPETYAHTVKLFGERDSLDLALLMEEHAINCGILTVFNQQLPAGQKPLLPIS
ncbi:MAG: hypothetical protein HY313_08155 [Acidobacteria bacterium]|nr:hypothetical protein [Acidobacteriota bacterium]